MKNDYSQKYIIYKKKYLELKKITGGVDFPKEITRHIARYTKNPSNLVGLIGSEIRQNDKLKLEIMIERLRENLYDDTNFFIELIEKSIDNDKTAKYIIENFIGKIVVDNYLNPDKILENFFIGMTYSLKRTRDATIKNKIFETIDYIISELKKYESEYLLNESAIFHLIIYTGIPEKYMDLITGKNVSLNGIIKILQFISYFSGSNIKYLQTANIIINNILSENVVENLIDNVFNYINIYSNKSEYKDYLNVLKETIGEKMHNFYMHEIIGKRNNFNDTVYSLRLIIDYITSREIEFIVDRLILNNDISQLHELFTDIKIISKINIETAKKTLFFAHNKNRELFVIIIENYDFGTTLVEFINDNLTDKWFDGLVIPYIIKNEPSDIGFIKNIISFSHDRIIGNKFNTRIPLDYILKMYNIHKIFIDDEYKIKILEILLNLGTILFATIQRQTSYNIISALINDCLIQNILSFEIIIKVIDLSINFNFFNEIVDGLNFNNYDIFKYVILNLDKIKYVNELPDYLEIYTNKLTELWNLIISKIIENDIMVTSEIFSIVINSLLRMIIAFCNCHAKLSNIKFINTIDNIIIKFISSIQNSMTTYEDPYPYSEFNAIFSNIIDYDYCFINKPDIIKIKNDRLINYIEMINKSEILLFIREKIIFNNIEILTKIKAIAQTMLLDNNKSKLYLMLESIEKYRKDERDYEDEDNDDEN